MYLKPEENKHFYVFVSNFPKFLLRYFLNNTNRKNGG